MKFGVFYELQLPKPWGPNDEYDLLNHALDQIELADRLGYDYAWEVEHHFLEEYSHSSAPEVFLAAGQPADEEHPAGPRHRPADRRTTRHASPSGSARSTCISHGRVELGIGEGSSVTELHPFDRRFREQARGVGGRRALPPADVLGGGLGVPRRVLRLPAAQRHPQAAPDSPTRRCGWPAASSTPSSWPARAASARSASSSSAPRRPSPGSTPTTTTTSTTSTRSAPYRTNPNIAVVSQFMCAADRRGGAQAEPTAATFFQFALRFYNEHGPVVPGTTSLWDEYQVWKQSPSGQKAQHGGLVGSPETIRAKLHKFAESNVDQVILLNQAGRNRHEDICEALELFATEVMPEFHADGARAPGVEAARARRRDRAGRDRHRRRTTTGRTSRRSRRTTPAPVAGG